MNEATKKLAGVTAMFDTRRRITEALCAVANDFRGMQGLSAEGAWYANWAAEAIEAHADGIALEAPQHATMGDSEAQVQELEGRIEDAIAELDKMRRPDLVGTGMFDIAEDVRWILQGANI